MVAAQFLALRGEEGLIGFVGRCEAYARIRQHANPIPNPNSQWEEHDPESGQHRLVGRGATVPPSPSFLQLRVRPLGLAVSWGPVHGFDVKGYELELSDLDAGSWECVYRGKECEYSVPDLQPGASYKARVRCRSNKTKGLWTEVAASPLSLTLTLTLTPIGGGHLSSYSGAKHQDIRHRRIRSL